MYKIGSFHLPEHSHILIVKYYKEAVENIFLKVFKYYTVGEKNDLLRITKLKLEENQIPFEHQAMGEGRVLLLVPCSKNE